MAALRSSGLWCVEMGQGMCLQGYGLESRALYMGSQILNSPGWGEAKALVVTDVMGVVGGVKRLLPSLWGSDE